MKRYPIHAISCQLIVLLIGVIVISLPVAADESKRSTEAKKSSVARYSTFKTNYALLISRRSGDDPAISVRLSGRYRYLDCEDSSAIRFCNKATFDNAYKFKSYISYTHDFDFYVWSDSTLERHSEPVVNRMTSPGLHFEWTSRNEWPTVEDRWRTSSRTLSVIHHSNGQSLDRRSQFGEISDSELPQAIEDLEKNNRAWRDGISRGWNYLELKYRFTFLHGLNENPSARCIEHLGCSTFYLAAKKRIFPIDDGIWWEPGNRSKFSDYNLLELTYSNEFKVREQDRKLQRGEYSFTLSCGTKGCGANAWARMEAKWPFPNVPLPWMFYIRGGPNEHFYNYHEDTFAVGIGLQFRP